MRRVLWLLPLLLLGPIYAQAAVLSVSAPSNVKAGATFNVPVVLSTEGSESANAVSGTVTFPSSLLQLVAISKSGSVITLCLASQCKAARRHVLKE